MNPVWHYEHNLVLSSLDAGPSALTVHLSRITATMKETAYKGFLIVECEYDGPKEAMDSFGFQVSRLYKVTDDFGDPALPNFASYFWSPADAAQAIDMYLWAKNVFPERKWATSPAYEYNQMLMHRRRMPEVYEALSDIGEILKQCAEFGDNPSEEIKQRLIRLDGQIRSWVRHGDPVSDDGF